MLRLRPALAGKPAALPRIINGSVAERRATSSTDFYPRKCNFLHANRKARLPNDSSDRDKANLYAETIMPSAITTIQNRMTTIGFHLTTIEVRLNARNSTQKGVFHAQFAGQKAIQTSANHRQ